MNSFIRKNPIKFHKFAPMTLVLLFVLVLINVGAMAQGVSGATLQASKTVDICDNGNGTWHYSGVVSVWNNGNADACGLQIYDCIQNKIAGPIWTNNFCQNLDVTSYGSCSAYPSGTGLVPGLTSELQAETFNYAADGAPLLGSIRNDASVTIMNHSGGKVNGPEPKDTYSGIPPAVCQSSGGGCTLTQGYWKNHTDKWPVPYSPTNMFYISGQTWLEVFNTPVSNSPGYYQLADQFMAALLNQANGASVPSGVQGILNQADAWLVNNGPSACTGKGSCGTQKTWAAILDEYNNGLYPGGPVHCNN
jgi:hypothetical protein